MRSINPTDGLEKVKLRGGPIHRHGVRRDRHDWSTRWGSRRCRHHHHRATTLRCRRGRRTSRPRWRGPRAAGNHGGWCRWGSATGPSSTASRGLTITDRSGGGHRWRARNARNGRRRWTGARNRCRRRDGTGGHRSGGGSGTRCAVAHRDGERRPIRWRDLRLRRSRTRWPLDRRAVVNGRAGSVLAFTGMDGTVMLSAFSRMEWPGPASLVGHFQRPAFHDFASNSRGVRRHIWLFAEFHFLRFGAGCCGRLIRSAFRPENVLPSIQLSIMGRDIGLDHQLCLDHGESADNEQDWRIQSTVPCHCVGRCLEWKIFGMEDVWNGRCLERLQEICLKCSGKIVEKIDFSKHIPAKKCREAKKMIGHTLSVFSSEQLSTQQLAEPVGERKKKSDVKWGWKNFR